VDARAFADGEQGKNRQDTGAGAGDVVPDGVGAREEGAELGGDVVEQGAESQFQPPGDSGGLGAEGGGIVWRGIDKNLDRIIGL
jgi:hypothetical protein